MYFQVKKVWRELKSNILYLLLSARIIFPAGSVTRAEISEMFVLDDMLPKFVPDDSLHRRQTLSLNTVVTSPEKEILKNDFFCQKRKFRRNKFSITHAQCTLHREKFVFII